MHCPAGLSCTGQVEADETEACMLQQSAQATQEVSVRAGQAPCEVLQGAERDALHRGLLPAKVAGCRRGGCVKLCKSPWHALGRECTRLRTVQTGCARSCRAARNAAGSSRRRQGSRRPSWLSCGRTCGMNRGGAAAIWPPQQVIHTVVAGSADGLVFQPPLACCGKWASHLRSRLLIRGV